MAPEHTIAERVALFKELALFRDLPEAELQRIAAPFIEYELGRGEELYEQGERAENLYVVLSGSLRCELVNRAGQVVPSALQTGDVFGARSLGLDGAELSRVKALHNSQLLYLPRTDLARLAHAYPMLSERLRTLAAGRVLKPEVEFDWLGRDEAIQFVARKHVAYLWTRLARAMGVAIAGLLAVLVAIEAADPTPWLLGAGGLLAAAVAWGAWEVLDWRNDFYILSDQRVVWLEQILLRSASRVEAPLDSVQSVNMHSSLLGRWLGFGDVIVQTYTGTVLMPSVGDPETIKFLVEEYVSRQRKGARQARHESIRQAVRESLGTAPVNAAARRGEWRPYAGEVRTERLGFFRTRTIDGDKIIYHRHWFTLLGSLALPALFLVGVLFAVNLVYGGLPNGAAGWLITLAALASPLAVIAYRYVDWQNDVYLLTPDSLMDSEKKPLGSLVTKTAPLANVLSLENHRIGILGLLFNFGVVRINVGDSSLDFDGVHDPAQVQQDIFARIEALKLRTQQANQDEERKRMAEWLRVYEEERGRAQRSANGDSRAVE
jgi:hypothetical protein